MTGPELRGLWEIEKGGGRDGGKFEWGRWEWSCRGEFLVKGNLGLGGDVWDTMVMMVMGIIITTVVYADKSM